MPKNQGVKHASTIFAIAGWYGILVLTPLYFLEAKIGLDMPPAVTHPEFFYGFIGVGLAWQILFLIIAKKPMQYRLVMIPAILEKVSYGLAVIVLFALDRIATQILVGGAVDLVFAALFLYAFRANQSA